MSTITPETTVSDAELATLAGVSARRIRQMIESGDLERVERGRLALGASVKALIELAAGNGSALQRERTRAIKAQADLRELELMRARGAVALISDFERVTVARNAVLRQNMLNIGQRACLRLLGEKSEEAFKRVMREEVTLALKSAAEATLDLQEDEAVDAPEL